MRYWWKVGWVALLGGLLACGPVAQVPAPTVPIVPIGAAATDVPAAAPTMLAVAATTVAAPASQGRVVFARSGQLWEWNGTDIRVLPTQGNLSHPAISPDGQTLAAVERGESYSDVVLFPPAQNTPTRLTNGISVLPLHSYERVFDSTWSFYPAFTADGAALVYAGQAAPPGGSPAAEYRMSLYRVPASAGASRTQLWARSDGHLGRVAPAPDGTLLLAFAPAGEEAPGLLRYDPRLGDALPLANVPTDSYDPAVAADGAIAYAHREQGSTDIYVLPVGRSPVKITTQGTARAPVFSPDGRMLAYLAVAPGGQGFDLWVVNLDVPGGQLTPSAPRRITTDGGIDADSGLAWGR